MSDLECNWIKANKSIHDYPAGTKFSALGGGFWVKTERGGFKWCVGHEFGSVGGDWNGKVCLLAESVAKND